MIQLRPKASLVVLVCVLAVAPLNGQEIPDKLRFTGSAREVPDWVSAESVVSAAGSLRNEYLLPWEVQLLLDRLEGDRERRVRDSYDLGQCTAWTRTILEGIPLTLAEAAGRAIAALSGTVVTARQGFLRGKPGELLAIDVEAWLAKLSPIPTRTYLFYPHAEIPVGDAMLCQMGERHPDHPHPGGRILVVAYERFETASGDAVFIAADAGLFFQVSPAGPVSLPLEHGNLQDGQAGTPTINHLIEHQAELRHEAAERRPEVQ